MRQFRRRRDRSEHVYEANPPVFVLLGAFLLFFLRFGYDYANSDQDEVIPYLLHHLDPGLFTQDWFVATQLSEFSVRTYFVWVLNAFSLILPVWLTTLLLFIVVWVFIAGAVYKLAFFFTGDQMAAAASVFVALVFTPIWTLGGNDLVHSMLVASMVAWALSLWAIYHYLRGRFLISPVLLGVACWMQALVGLHVALLLVALRAIRWIRREPGPHTLGGILVFGALFLLWSSPALGPVIYQQLVVKPEAVPPDVSLFYILAEFRLPHHYLPSSFYTHSYVRFGALAVLGLGSLFSVRHRRSIQRLDFILRSLVLIGIFCLVATVFTEFVPVLLIAKLQFFKMTVLAKLLFIILICGAVTYFMPEALRRLLRSILSRPRLGLAIVLVLCVGVAVAAVRTQGYLHDLVGPFWRAQQPIGEVQSWIKRNTATSAIFAVPPSYSSFRSETHRTIVINYKAVPFEDEQMIVWFNRLIDMAPIELPDRAGPQIMAQLDSAFANLSAPELRELSERYRFEYVVRPAPLATDTGRRPASDTSEVRSEAVDPGAAPSGAPSAGEQASGASASDALTAGAPSTGAAGISASSASDDRSDTTGIQIAGPRRFSEVFRAGELYVYRLTPEADDEEAEAP